MCERDKILSLTCGQRHEKGLKISEKKAGIEMGRERGRKGGDIERGGVCVERAREREREIPPLLAHAIHFRLSAKADSRPIR